MRVARKSFKKTKIFIHCVDLIGKTIENLSRGKIMATRPFFLFAALFMINGCLESRNVVYSTIDPNAKTITVPMGNGPLVGRIKQSLQNSGWQLMIDQGPVRTRGEFGPHVALETSSTYRTRYRLAIAASQVDWCIIGSPSIVYDLSLVDNMTGREVIAQSGRDCESSAADKFMTSIRNDAARR